ncbi:HAD family hydrolase [Janibacter sp. GXQ6167]|uniref:HAD family hydrolase n=1 Tax=Janibacter sp. GXQ6167 TaxID=3240791 RepID=UPI003523E0AC
MSKLPEAVLWDMDGTLVDTEPYWITAEHELVSAWGGSWTDELAHQCVGNDLIVTGEIIVANSPVELSPHEVVDHLLARVLEQIAIEVPWRPGARALLADAVAKGVPNALVTMSWRSLAEAVVAALETDTFDAVITGDEVSHGKPHPEPYLAATRALGVTAGGSVALEDSPTGVRSATAAGVPTIAIPHVVPVPVIAGAVQVPTLVGLGVADLVDLAATARRR